MKRVLIADKLAPEGMKILQDAGLELDLRSGLTGDALKAALAENDGVIIRSGTRLTAEYLQGQRRLKVIVRAGVGVDNIEVPAATREGIVVMNTPGGNTLSTAEQTIALMLAVCRHIAAADASMRGGQWERTKFVGSQVAGKTLGMIGLGRVGLAVAKRAMGLEMKVVGYDPFLPADRAAQMGIKSVPTPNDVYPHADILTVHVPLSDETKGLVGAKELAMLPKGAYVLNCARGGIVDETALLAALESKQIAGAALDVYADEPGKNGPFQSPFAKFPNVVLSPHLGASTAEAQLNVALEAAELMVDFLNHGKVKFAVNLASLDAAELREVQRYIDIARRLGLLQAQLANGPVRRASISYRGEVAKKNTKFITAAFAMGLIESALEESVNLVNVLLLAKERGLEIVEQTSTETTDFSSLIRTEVESDQGSLIAAGTTRGNSYHRLVQLGPYRFDAFLEGTMLVFHHRDVPGIIGLVGTVFGKHGVNIAQMITGRSQPGRDAIGVLALDGVPPAAALAEIRNDPRMNSVNVVKLPPLGEQPTGLV